MLCSVITFSQRHTVYCLLCSEHIVYSYYGYSVAQRLQCGRYACMCSIASDIVVLESYVHCKAPAPSSLPVSKVMIQLTGYDM
jgi:hypothetical protein